LENKATFGFLQHIKDPELLCRNPQVHLHKEPEKKKEEVRLSE
jgi:hypothetical protein